MTYSEIKELKELIGDYWREAVEEMQTEVAEFYIKSGGAEYRFINEDVIDDIYYNEVKETIIDCYNLNVPSFVEIDWDKTIDNCMYDGYGHTFSSYDGSEDQIANYYIFRVK